VFLRKENVDRDRSFARARAREDGRECLPSSTRRKARCGPRDRPYCAQRCSKGSRKSMTDSGTGDGWEGCRAGYPTIPPPTIGIYTVFLPVPLFTLLGAPCSRLLHAEHWHRYPGRSVTDHRALDRELPWVGALSALPGVKSVNIPMMFPLETSALSGEKKDNDRIAGGTPPMYAGRER